MKKILTYLVFPVLVAGILTACSKDNDDDDNGSTELLGDYQIEKVEVTVQGFPIDITQLAFTECDLLLKISFKPNRVLEITDPELLCNEEEVVVSTTYTLNDNQLETDIEFFSGEIVTYTQDQLVVSGTYEEQTARITLKKYQSPVR